MISPQVFITPFLRTFISVIALRMTKTVYRSLNLYGYANGGICRRLCSPVAQLLTRRSGGSCVRLVCGLAATVWIDPTRNYPSVTGVSQFPDARTLDIQKVGSSFPLDLMLDFSYAMSSTAALYFVLAAVGLYVVKQWLSPSKPYPPGPRPLPFIGNVLDIPQQYQWRRFCEWKGRYGMSLISLPWNKLLNELRRCHICYGLRPTDGHPQHCPGLP